MKYHLKIRSKPGGNIYIPVLIVTTLFVTLGMIATAFVGSQSKLANQKKYKTISLQIAEAGIEYYRWHLAHADTDYQDGTGGPGPYTHDYYNLDGQIIGQFVLDITSPPNGSTIVNILSNGHVNERPSLIKAIKVKMGIPSFATYAVAANNIMRFGEGTEVYGPIHSNDGVRFDGIAHNIVTSHVQSYDDPDSDACTVNSWGVHTCVNPDDPSPPTALPVRNDVFMAGRSVGAPTIPFNTITQDLGVMQTAAQANGIHLAAAGSGFLGYHVTFKTSGKVDIRKVVNALRCQYQSGTSWRDFGYCSQDFNRYCYQTTGGSNTGCSYCTNDQSWRCSANSDCNGQCSLNQSRNCFNNSTCIAYGEGTCITGATCTTTGVSCLQSSHSIGTRATDQEAFTYKSASSLNIDLATQTTNGLIFLEDDVWVDGVIDNSRVTVVAAKTPLNDGMANIYINNDLTYTPVADSSGADALGLVAQNNILVGYFSENDIHIDGAMIAQKGRVGRPYYGISNSTWRLYPTDSVASSACNACRDCRRRLTLTAAGSLGTYQRYGFAWVGSQFNCPVGTNASGYCTRNLIYDENFYFSPPPYFPTTGQYRIISWEEV